MDSYIFINYRGDDSHSYAALLYAELSRHFGPHRVFLDSVSIPAGADFESQLLSRVRSARVVLAIIGPSWLSTYGSRGKPRIDDPADWIRRELVEAFAANVRVIPILTDYARIPVVADLPEDIAALGRCQFRHLRHRDAPMDLARLINELAEIEPDLSTAAGLKRSPVADWPVPNQLPAAPRYFVGRQAELAQLVAPTTELPSAVVVSAVDGMAGVGKTGLAVHAAHHLTASGKFPDGTLFIDLQGFSERDAMEPVDAIDILLHGLGVPGPQIPPNSEARIALYRTITARRRVLVVLDNVRDERQARPLLPGSPSCFVMITSRKRLAGLDEAKHITLSCLTLDEAVNLFNAVLGVSDDRDEQTVRQVVRLCGLLPLAIRIAAARLMASRAWDCGNLLEALRTTRDIERLRTLDDGERSVWAALEISYQHLTPRERVAFSTLALHPGTQLESYATAALLETSPSDASNILAALEQVNLLEQATAGRYRYHDLVRPYASSLAFPGALARQAVARLRTYYAETASAAITLAYPEGDVDAATLPSNTHLPFTNRVEALAWLDREQPNLLATAHHAESHDEPRHTTTQAATLKRHIRIRASLDDIQKLHRVALRAAQTVGDRSAELSALNELGWTYYVQGRHKQAAEFHNTALNLARAMGDTSGEITALAGLGRGYNAQGDYTRGTEQHTKALALARATSDIPGELAALIGIGWSDSVKGAHDSAAASFDRAIELADQPPRRPSIALAAFNGLGHIHRMRRRFDLALDSHARALEIAHDLGDPVGQLNALTGLGHVYHRQNEPGPATDCYTRALKLARLTGDANGEATSLVGLGYLHHRRGLSETAIGCFRQVLEVTQATGDRNGQCEGHLGLGFVHQAAGEYPASIAACRQALDLAVELDQPTDEVRALNWLGFAYRGLHLHTEAQQSWRRALDILTRLDLPASDEVTAADIIAQLAELGVDQPDQDRPPEEA